jgi:hypothetical protein
MGNSGTANRIPLQVFVVLCDSVFPIEVTHALHKRVEILHEVLTLLSKDSLLGFQFLYICRRELQHLLLIHFLPVVLAQIGQQNGRPF